MKPATTEAALVQDIRAAAEAMGVFLAEVSQRGGRHSGTSLGFPDLVAMVAGHTILIETKRTKTPEHPRGRLNLGQQAFMERAAEHGVTVHVVDTVQQFADLVNAARRSKRA